MSSRPPTDAPIRVEIDAVIERPIEQVFDRLVDIPGYNDWMPRSGLFVSCTTRAADPVREGTSYVDRTRLGPVHGEVVAFERPTRVVFHYTARMLGTTVMEGWPGYELEPAGDTSTRVRHVATGQPRSFFRLLRPLVQWLAENERRRTVDALKQSFALSEPADE